MASPSLIGGARAPVMIDTQSDRSKLLYNIAVSSQVVVARKDTAAAKEQRKWLLVQIRNAVIDDGKALVSDSDEVSFSQHGSLFHRLRIPGSTDIDVYVGLNGGGLRWGVQALAGRADVNHNLTAFALPLTAPQAAQWMVGIVRKVLGRLEASHKVSASRRGAVISGFGPKKRDYDIIPAFLYRDARGDIHHIIPAGDTWETHCTSQDMRMVIELDRDFARAPQRHVLGYRDLVKLMKRLSAELQWKKEYGITSFMIRFAVSESLEASVTRFNHKQLARAIAKLQEWMDAGRFYDTYTQSYQMLPRSRPALNAGAEEDQLSQPIMDALLRVWNKS